MIFSTYPYVQGFKCLLDPLRLSPIGIVKHYTYRLIACCFDILHPCMFFGDVITIRSWRHAI